MLSGFSRYISCYIAESHLPLGQCAILIFRFESWFLTWRRVSENFVSYAKISHTVFEVCASEESFLKAKNKVKINFFLFFDQVNNNFAHYGGLNKFYKTFLYGDCSLKKKKDICNFFGIELKKQTNRQQCASFKIS